MTKLIKKYKNRRLYDTEISRHITIETLNQYILNQVDFKIETADTVEDITNTVLLQLLIEMQGKKNQFLSTALLKQLILAANHPSSALFKESLEQLSSMWHLSTEQTPFKQTAEQWQKMWGDWFKA